MGACGLTQLKITSINNKPINPYTIQCTMVKTDSKIIEGALNGAERAASCKAIDKTEIRNAPNRLAQSNPPNPGKIRRRGMTNQSVSLNINCPKASGGLTRTACIQNRNNKSPAKKLLTVSIIKTRILVITLNLYKTMPQNHHYIGLSAFLA